MRRSSLLSFGSFILCSLAISCTQIYGIDQYKIGTVVVAPPDSGTDSTPPKDVGSDAPVAQGSEGALVVAGRAGTDDVLAVLNSLNGQQLTREKMRILGMTQDGATGTWYMVNDKNLLLARKLDPKTGAWTDLGNVALTAAPPVAVGPILDTNLVVLKGYLTYLTDVGNGFREIRVVDIETPSKMQLVAVGTSKQFASSDVSAGNFAGLPSFASNKGGMVALANKRGCSAATCDIYFETYLINGSGQLDSATPGFNSSLGFLKSGANVSITSSQSVKRFVVVTSGEVSKQANIRTLQVLPTVAWLNNAGESVTIGSTNSEALSYQAVNECNNIVLGLVDYNYFTAFSFAPSISSTHINIGFFASNADLRPAIDVFNNRVFVIGKESTNIIRAYTVQPSPLGIGNIPGVNWAPPTDLVPAAIRAEFANKKCF